MSGSLYQSCRLPALSPYYLFSLWGEGSQAHTPILIHSSQTAAHWCAQLQQRYQQQYFPSGAEIWETASAGTQGGQGEKEMLEPRNQVVVCKAGGWLRARLLVYFFFPMMFCFLEGMQLRESEARPSNTQAADRYYQCTSLLFSPKSSFCFWSIRGSLSLQKSHPLASPSTENICPYSI